MSADAAIDFLMATLAVALQDIDEGALLTFAAAFIPATFAGRLGCAADVEALVNECLPGNPAAAREVAALVDRMVPLARQDHG